MTVTTLIALAISSALLLGLCLGDPKRRRAQRINGGEQSQMLRRLLTVGALLPGVCLAFLGDSAAFLIWFGACCVIGWLIALGFARSKTPA